MLARAVLSRSVGDRWLTTPRGVLMRQDHRRRAEFQRALDDHPWIHRDLVDRAFEQGFARERLVLGIQKHNRKNFVRLGDEFQTQVITHVGGTAQRRPGLEDAAFQQGDGLLDDPVFMLCGDQGE
jgi:hypothetical protein